MISLENLGGFPWKSATDLSPMNPPKILINSEGNLREIRKESTWKISLNFRADSRFTYNPNFPVDSPPPCIRHPRGFPAESAWFCPLSTSDHHWEKIGSRWKPEPLVWIIKSADKLHYIQSRCPSFPSIITCFQCLHCIVGGLLYCALHYAGSKIKLTILTNA